MDENTPEAPQPTPPVEHSVAGPAIGALIIIVLLVAGALFFWTQEGSEAPKDLPYIPPEPTAQNWTPPSGTSDETDSL